MNQYKTDIDDDYHNRIIKDRNSIPELIFFKEDIIDLLDLLKKHKGTLEQFIDSNIEFIKSFNFDTIVKLWILEKKQKFDLYFYDELDTQLTSITKKYKLKIDFQIKDRIDDQFLKDKIKEFKERVEKRDIIHSVLDETIEQSHSDFNKTKYHVYLKTDIEDTSLEYIFDSISCNENIPFSMFKNICKIYKPFSNQPELYEWSKQEQQKILLKLKGEEEYMNCFLFNENNILNMEVSVNTKSYLNIEKIKEYIKIIITIPFEFLEESDEHDIDGIYLFPNQRFNKFLLSDMIMNNPLMSTFLAVDESAKASTKKTGLLLKFRGSSCNIICKTGENETEDLGPHYIRARLTRFKDIETIELFISILSKCFTIYHTSPKNKKLKEYYKDLYNERELFKIYTDFLGKSFVLEDKERTQKETTKFEDIAPELFKSNNIEANYNRDVCQGKKRHPQIIKDSTDLKEYSDYILFPKDSDKQYIFTCKDNEEYKYIGLAKNKLDNDHEYLPCCYLKEKHNINKYYYDEEEQLGKQQIIIKTLDRLLPRNYIGELPSDISVFIKNLYQMGEELYRKGVSDSKHSFIECIKTITEKEVKITDFSIASQENPDLTLDQMSELFHNQDIYLDPKRWIRLLEYYYQVNIYVFSRQGKNKTSTLMIPNHKGIHLKYKNNYPKTVFILENQKGKEKRCELIVFEKPSKFYKYFFENQSFIEDKFTQFYLTPTKKPLIKFTNHPPLYQYKSQILDSYKKTRCLITTNDVYLLCDPIPPLPLPIEYTNEYESDMKAVEEFLQKEIDSMQDIKVGMFTIKLKRKKEDHLDIFSKNKKIAFVLGELFIYLYSTFVNKKQLSLENGKDVILSIKQFIDSKIVVENKEYDLPHSVIIPKIKKLVVKDNETLKRLICLLRLRLINNEQQVKNYFKQKELFQYYKEIENYSSHFNTFLVNHKNINKILSFSNMIYKTVQSLSKYFLLHRKQIYIVEQVTELSDDHLFIYDEHLNLLEERQVTKEKKLHVIKYQDRYQKMVLISS